MSAPGKHAPPAQYIPPHHAPPAQYIPPHHDPPTAPVVRVINSWEVGLFDCFCAPGHACCAFCFPYFSAAYTAHYIRQSAVLTGLFFFVTELGSVFFASVLPANKGETTALTTASLSCSVMFTVGVLVLRHTVRMYYHIPGSVTRDCCAAICWCCALAQMSTHTERFKDRLSTLPGYDRRFEGESEWLRSEGGHVDESRVEEGYHALK